MIEILLAVGIFSIALVGFALSLHFSKYKRGNSACCGGGHCQSHHNDGKSTSGSCYSDKLNYIDDKVISRENG
ncbi:MAG: hypothetical protein JW995_14785 [Melioribacteraceae bacterium]|nr:hypothetical protein [Melioribacteraceae bacterium]